MPIYQKQSLSVPYYLSQADLIVSGDKHLRDLGGSYQGIAIVSPAQAVQRIAG